MPPCAGPIKAKPFGWPRKPRPALTVPAHGGCENWRSGRKNARGADRTKELALCDCRFKPRVLVGGASPDGPAIFAPAPGTRGKPLRRGVCPATHMAESFA